MMILCWNYQGLGNPQTVRELCQKVKKKCPDLVFLREAKLHNNKMVRIKQKLGYNNMLVVDSVGRSGGLVLFWKHEMGLEILNYSRRHIHAIIKPINMTPWWFTGFYGHPEAHKRSGEWDLLKHLKMSVRGGCGFARAISMKFWSHLKNMEEEGDLST